MKLRSKGFSITVPKSSLLSFAAREQSIPDWLKTHKPTYSALQRSLPENIHLLTLEATNPNKAIIRFENIYAKGENPRFAKVTSFALDGLFSEFDVVNSVELNLAANQFASDKKQLNWKTESGTVAQDAQGCLGEQGSKWIITVGPMEICTIECQIKRK